MDKLSTGRSNSLSVLCLFTRHLPLLCVCFGIGRHRQRAIRFLAAHAIHTTHATGSPVRPTRCSSARGNELYGAGCSYRVQGIPFASPSTVPYGPLPSLMVPRGPGATVVPTVDEPLPARVRSLRWLTMKSQQDLGPNDGDNACLQWPGVMRTRLQRQKRSRNHGTGAQSIDFPRSAFFRHI